MRELFQKPTDCNTKYNWVGGLGRGRVGRGVDWKVRGKEKRQEEDT